MTSNQIPGLLGGIQLPVIEWQPDVALLAIEETRARLLSHGVVVPPRSRLILAKETIRRVVQFNVRFGYGDPSTERSYAEAHRTAFEMYLIVRELQPPTDAIRRDLRQMLGGPAVPVLGRFDPSRNKQAEFFAGLMLFAAGFRVDPGGPDLLLQQRRSRLAAAVKRVTSARNFDKRLSKARDQLSDYGRSGFIVVSADQLLEEAYAASRDADLSRIHYDRIARWTNRLTLKENANRVISVIGLSTSFRHQQGTANAMQVAVHFHQLFVTWQKPALLRSANVVGAAMGAAIARTLKVTLSDLVERHRLLKG